MDRRKIDMTQGPIFSKVLLFRVPCAYVIAKFFDGTYIMVGHTASFIFAMLCMLGYCAFSKRWKTFLRGERSIY